MAVYYCLISYSTVTVSYHICEYVIISVGGAVAADWLLIQNTEPHNDILISLSLTKCYPSYRLMNGVNRYTASSPHVAPHQPVNHHTTVTKATVAGAGSDPSHKSVEE